METIAASLLVPPHDRALPPPLRHPSPALRHPQPGQGEAEGKRVMPALSPSSPGPPSHSAYLQVVLIE